MGRHRGGRGFQGFHQSGIVSRVRGRKIGSDDLQLIFLLLLEERPCHGYELIKALEQRSSGFYSPSPGMVYPALTSLEELGYATVSPEGGRKLYHLAPSGRSHLAQHRAAAETVVQQLEQFGRSLLTAADTAGPLAPATPPPASKHHAARKALSLGVSADRVLARLRREAEEQQPLDGGSISQEQGELIYLLCRQLRAKCIVDFATSVGVSAIYMGAVMRDCQEGHVIGSEIVPQRVAAARRNLDEAGVDGWVAVYEGDGRETMRDVLVEPVDFALIDAGPSDAEHSLAREVVEIVAPKLRRGGMLMNANGEPDYLEYVRDPRNGFISITLPMKGGTELSLKR